METGLIQRKIHDVRTLKVMLDFDLADLYEVETKVLKQTVKRNIERFPSDFMFQLTEEEWSVLKLKNEPSKGRGGTRYAPYAFTEQGLAMLSGVLRSKKAIEVNIAIMRAFVEIRNFALSYGDLADRLKGLEYKYDDVYDALKYLLNKDQQELAYNERKRIGYSQNEIE